MTVRDYIKLLEALPQHLSVVSVARGDTLQDAEGPVVLMVDWNRNLGHEYYGQHDYLSFGEKANNPQQVVAVW